MKKLLLSTCILSCLFFVGCESEEEENDRIETQQTALYDKNKERIDYGTFMEKGYLIGSGAIEAAHRNVIQKRLKLSGQRWIIKDVQQIANLRVCQKSNQWNRVVNLIINEKNAA